MRGLPRPPLAFSVILMSNSVLYVYEGFRNPGDSFSYCGARHYINESIPVVCEQGAMLRSTKDIPSRLDLSGPDLVVFAGAPWFWEGCTKSVKYAGAYAFLQMTPNVRKVAIGVGSCFLANHTKSAIESIIKSEHKELQLFWKSFDLIIVRDILAWWILSLVGVDAVLAPCPSIAVGNWYGRISVDSGTVILSEPLEKNFMYSYMSKEDETSYLAMVERLTKAGAANMEWVLKDRSTLASRSLKSMCQEVEAAQASTFFTARVHAALVAMGMGLRGDLLALDSRALSAKLHGATLVGSHAEAFCGLSDQLEAVAPPVADIGDSIHHSLETLL